MKLYLIIGDLTSFFWILFPFFLKKNKHFYYFLFGAIIEFSTLILYKFFNLSGQSLWISMHFLMLVFFDRNYVHKYKWPIFVGFLISLPISFNSSNITQDYTVFFFHVIFLLLFSRYFLKIYFDFNKVDFFYIAMILYEILTLFKLISMLKDFKTGMNIFYATDITQVFIGIFIILLNTKFFSKIAVIEVKEKAEL